MLKITRYPETKNKSLKPWSAADELILEYISGCDLQNKRVAIYNDRFGFLSANLNSQNPWIVTGYRSQKKAIEKNFESNGLSIDENRFVKLPEPVPEMVDINLVRIPKSMELFKLFLWLIYGKSDEKTVVVCSFMTKYFTPQMLKISNMFFEVAEQSKAKKKSRLLILKTPKKLVNDIEIIEKISWEGLELKQYSGVFSSSKIDFATRFLLENFKINKEETKILDLAAGNGIIGLYILKQYQKNKFEQPELHLLDDSALAIESAKMNLPENCVFHYEDTLENLPANYFDLIITNPPFHFEHEINTEVSIRLFKETYIHLKNGGRFVLVFNRHLVNYRTVLKRIFQKVNLVADSPKYIALECWK